MTFRLRLIPKEGEGTAKYWTGQMLGSWPVALKAPGRALAIDSRADATSAVLQFNQRYIDSAVQWEVEEIE